MSRFVPAYLFLALCAVAGSFAGALGLGMPGPTFDPLKAHAPCTQQVAGPTERWLCSDGRAYDRWDGRWHDAGAITPAPSALPSA